jgi:hypothetical protein
MSPLVGAKRGKRPVALATHHTPRHAMAHSTLHKLTDADAHALAEEKAQQIDLSRWDTDEPYEIAEAYADRAVARGLPKDHRTAYAAAFLAEVSSRL